MPEKPRSRERDTDQKVTTWLFKVGTEPYESWLAHLEDSHIFLTDTYWEIAHDPYGLTGKALRSILQAFISKDYLDELAKVHVSLYKTDPSIETNEAPATYITFTAPQNAAAATNQLTPYYIRDLMGRTSQSLVDLGLPYQLPVRPQTDRLLH